VHITLIHTSLVCSVLSLACLHSHAAELRLSSLLGVASGQSTSTDNPPFMDFISGADLGADTPGSWTSDPIQFGDAGILEHGIGQHPTQSDFSSVEFDLEAIAIKYGPVNSFSARVGIERFTQVGAGNNGATFHVLADGVEIANVAIMSGYVPSQSITVPLDGVRKLTLRTSRLGNYHGNHACWGLATLIVCAADFDRSGFIDTDDFTAFVVAFEEGTDNADFDSSGFVDTDDFTAFVLAFEAGC
jgi:hypothetical protein